MNFYYFFYIFWGIAFTLLVYFFFRNKGKKAQWWVVFGILLFNFCLHFLKLCFEPYRSELPLSVKKITLENICAVSTIVFPFFYLSKKNALRDYMFIVGIISGALSIISPTTALVNRPMEFDTIRYYLCHLIIIIAPLLMMLFGIHKFDYKRVLKVPFLFYGVLCLIVLNDVIMYGAGYSFGGLEELLDRNTNNASFIYGPSDDLEPIVKFLTFCTPELFMKYPFGENAGQLYYWPVLWMVVPAYFYTVVFGTILALPFEYKHMRADAQRLLSFVKAKTSKRE